MDIRAQKIGNLKKFHVLTTIPDFIPQIICRRYFAYRALARMAFVL